MTENNFTTAQDDWELLFGDLTTGIMEEIKSSIISINVSYSMTLVTQLSVEIVDTNFDLLRNNYFIVGRDVLYRTHVFTGKFNGDKSMLGTPTASIRNDNEWLQQLLEIASVEVSPGSGSSPIIKLELRTKAVQQMKRDKEPGTIKGDGSDFVIAAAKKYKLDYSVQKTSKKKQITKASGDTEADSTWTVMDGLASEAKYLLFECDGVLFFVSPHRLIGKWGLYQTQLDYIDPQTNKSFSATFNYIPLRWPRNYLSKNFVDIGNAFQLHQCPQVRQSEDDPLGAEGSATIDYLSGICLRPGMTVLLFGIPTFDGRPFLITEVSFNHFSREPVNISFASPERPDGKIINYEVGQIFPSTGLAGSYLFKSGGLI